MSKYMNQKITHEEIGEILIKIKVLFPYTQKTTTEEETGILINTWFERLSQYDSWIVKQAYNRTLDICKMPPTIADIIEQVNIINSALQKKPEQLWFELKTAADKVDQPPYAGREDEYKTNEELWDSLPEELKEFCNDIDYFLRLPSLSSEQLYFERIRFLKEYPRIKQVLEIRNEQDGVKKIGQSKSTPKIEG